MHATYKYLALSVNNINMYAIQDNRPINCYNQYFRLEDDNKNKDYLFQIRILLNDKIYKYGFCIRLADKKIKEEYLKYEYGRNNEKTIFSKNVEKSRFELGSYIKSPKARDRLSIYGNDSVNSNSLFLKEINMNKENMYKEIPELMIFKDLYNHIIRDIIVRFPTSSPVISPDFIKSNIETIGELLNAFDTGITKGKINRISHEKLQTKVPEDIIKDVYDDLIKEDDKDSRIVLRSNKQFFAFELGEEKEIIAQTIQFAHEKEDVFFDMDEESDGTTQLLDIIELLLNNEGNKIFVIDEIDRCLHPSLTVKLIELYLKASYNSNTQLLFTTHESKLLNLEDIRNDEISCIKKNTNGKSIIQNLDTLNLRTDKSIHTYFFEDNSIINATPIFNDSVLNKLLKNTDE